MLRVLLRGIWLFVLLEAPPISAQTPPTSIPLVTSETRDKFASAALAPFWHARRIREPVFFIRTGADVPPQASLLFKPDKVVSVTSATREIQYEVDRDYVFDEATATLRLPAGSRIPFKTMDQLYPLMTSDIPKIARQQGDKTRGVFFDNGAEYHRLQAEAIYEFSPGQWKGPIPTYAGDALPRTLNKLRNKEPVKIFLSGDSISAGYNASKFTQAKPGCPPYGELVALALEQHYGSCVTFKNYAVSGWSAGRGLQHAVEENLGQQKPDLMIIAFGMNDVFARDAAAYQKNIRGIMDAIRKDSPETEFILVASMLGNAEWGMPMAQFSLYRDALKELCGPGVALVDMTAIWEELLQHKSFYDLTGNGVNHPNDFGHLVYAQAILSLLVERATSPEVDRSSANLSPRDLLTQSRRIVFLGDSITAAGQYVAYFDAWLLTQKLEQPSIVIDAGLPSETVSGLSEEGHAGGKFPRPDLAERLDRVLAATKPDLVFACYGINCGIYQPLDEDRFQRYQRGVENLKHKVEHAGATLVLITPPFYDEQRTDAVPLYNAVLDRYSDWLLALRRQGWRVVDLHGPMTREVAERRRSETNFTFQPDAVHPNAEGHWFIARQLIGWFGDKAAATAASPQKMLITHGIPEDALELVQQRVNIFRDAYVSAAGHKRPGVAVGLPIPEADRKSKDLSGQIEELMKYGESKK